MLEWLQSLGFPGFAIFLMWKLVANHARHQTKALQDLTQAINELRDHLHYGK